MATVSFLNMDQAFVLTDNSIAAYASTDASAGALFSFLTTGGDDWEIVGSGLTYSGGLPTGGTVTAVNVDLDNDGGVGQELAITGLNLAATALGTGAGTANQQRDKFWAAVLGGADTVTFTMASYTNNFLFSGDGADISDGGLHLGANDSLLDGGNVLTHFSVIAGDFGNIIAGVAVGGNDTLTVGAYFLSGDFISVDPGATGIGGDDAIAPARLANTTYAALELFIVGDADVVIGLLQGGNDLIDLRSTIVTGVTQNLTIMGDAFIITSTGALLAGNDTIHGSALGEEIHGDYASSAGYVEGGKDRLFGYAGNDTIFGNEGRDQLFGHDGNDSLNGGIDGDIIDGGIGNDVMIGDTGNDSMLGGDGNDTMIGGSGSDTIDGGAGDDVSDASAGTDVMIGGAGRDSLFGGTGNDSITGDGGNDTLQGGDQNDTLLGGAGFDVLLGGNDNDTLDGGASNDILFGNAGNDTFVFSKGSATDTIRDMAAGASVADVINLVGFGAAFDTFAEVMAAATDNGTDTTINFGNGDVLIIQNVTVAGFNANDFIFG